jgi:hypothetical protein
MLLADVIVLLIRALTTPGVTAVDHPIAIVGDVVRTDQPHFARLAKTICCAWFSAARC